MHNAAFGALGLNWVYVPFHVRPDQLRYAARAIRALALAGVNITVPHKEAIVRFLDSCSPCAERAGAVNTVVLEGNKLHGDNTDVAGLLGAIRDARVRLRGRRAVLVGAGGAARAALVAFEQAGVREVVLVNRTRSRALALARRFRSGPCQLTVESPTALQSPQVLGEAAVVVNSTSLGLKGETFFPMRPELAPEGCLFLDLVYGRETDFQRQARRAGRRASGGLSMLLHQGARAFELWTHRRAPLAVMREALLRSTAQSPDGADM